MNQEPHIIRDGNFVILKLPNDTSKLIQVHAGRSVRLGRFGDLQIDDLIRKPFGLTFEFRAKKKRDMISDDNEFRIVPRIEINADFHVDSFDGANNRHIYDDSQNQAMSFSEIEELKKSNLSGEVNYQEVLKKLTDGNKAFNLKNKLSQAKYIKKKRQKFYRAFSAINPTGFELCNLLGIKHNLNIRQIREESLAAILSHANITEGGRYIVVDDVQGLVVASVIERMGYAGKVVTLNSSNIQQQDCVRFLNVDKDLKKSLLFQVPWNSLADCHDINDENNSKYKAARDELLAGDFDALIVASKYEPTSIVDFLIPFVGLSSPVVIYSSNIEPLSRTFVFMRRSPSFIMTHIREYWYREYQVYTNRLHPQNNVRGNGGFILTSVKVGI